MLPSIAARKGKVLLFDGVSGAATVQAMPAASSIPAGVLVNYNSIAALRAGGTGGVLGQKAMVGSWDGTAATAGGGMFACEGASGLADDGGDTIVAGAAVWRRDGLRGLACQLSARSATASPTTGRSSCAGWPA